MKYLSLTVLVAFVFASCSTKNQLVYLKDSDKHNTFSKLDYSSLNNNIEVGDILKIDIQTIVPEAAIPYNKITSSNVQSQNLDLLKLDGFLVDDFKMINYPVLGKISVEGLSENQLESKITQLLLDGNHLTNPTVKVRRVNSKFTVLGEVRSPGTYSYYDKNLNIFQALGYAGDLTIDGKRKDIRLVREENGNREIYKIELTEVELLNRPIFYIKNNDVLIVNPSFSKVKSAGFIGSPASVASIASLLLSITLLLTNN
ncbi:MAG: ligand-binding protein [Flavobacteriaceae bacterium]|nr:ligand-binding protein [Flavobacteriaceae bacterium]|tara:strand:+ start:944 stop:1717 length:774 start_codon:yes stop_codon:yes gene_type:complete